MEKKPDECYHISPWIGYTESMKLNDTLYLKSVKHPYSVRNVLKSGGNNKKLGRKITKGKWKGAYIFSLTLRERFTCPLTCHHWDDCYGNNMPFAHRFEHGPDLEDKLTEEVAALCAKHDKVAIRLHVLGDFMSVGYVRFWDGLMCVHPNLHVWGYTARTDAIGKEVMALNLRYPTRWAVRISASNDSNGPTEWYAAEEAFEGKSFDCPEQTGKAASCGDCGLCWQSPKTVRFLSH